MFSEETMLWNHFNVSEMHQWDAFQEISIQWHYQISQTACNMDYAIKHIDSGFCHVSWPTSLSDRRSHNHQHVCAPFQPWFVLWISVQTHHRNRWLSTQAGNSCKTVLFPLPVKMMMDISDQSQRWWWWWWNRMKMALYRIKHVSCGHIICYNWCSSENECWDAPTEMYIIA